MGGRFCHRELEVPGGPVPEGLWELGERRGGGGREGRAVRDMRRGARGGTSSGVTDASGFGSWGERAAGRGKRRGGGGEEMRKRFQVS